MQAARRGRRRQQHVLSGSVTGAGRGGAGLGGAGLARCGRGRIRRLARYAAHALLPGTRAGPILI